MTLDALLQAIDRFASDTGRSPEDTLAGLEDALQDIEMRVDALKEEVK